MSQKILIDDLGNYYTDFSSNSNCSYMENVRRKAFKTIEKGKENVTAVQYLTQTIKKLDESIIFYNISIEKNEGKYTLLLHYCPNKTPQIPINNEKIEILEEEINLLEEEIQFFEDMEALLKISQSSNKIVAVIDFIRSKIKKELTSKEKKIQEIQYDKRKLEQILLQKLQELKNIKISKTENLKTILPLTFQDDHLFDFLSYHIKWVENKNDLLRILQNF